MPNLRDIKRRITSVESTQKITSAMKMVSAAKLRRAQQAVESARPYATHMRETLEAAQQHPHYKAPLGENQGRGIACGFWFNGGMQSSATVSVNDDGSAVVRTGNPDIGGSRVSMAIT